MAAVAPVIPDARPGGRTCNVDLRGILVVFPRFLRGGRAWWLRRIRARAFSRRGPARWPDSPAGGSRGGARRRDACKRMYGRDGPSQTADMPAGLSPRARQDPCCAEDRNPAGAGGFAVMRPWVARGPSPGS